ncbi:MAG: YidC/Oxa1 family membrane protein insertase [Candidatus Falkowbacteria bacterium]|nr:YidC/Oxa1 family membrane protein insertase [Candidatus Falkowbacteria bacterium]
MANLFQEIFYRPILNLLVFLYNTIPGHDLGIAIILLTVVIKLILHPFSLQSLKSQKALQELQPKINELKEKYKDDKPGLSKATMEMYKENKVNPFSSCLPLLIQLPFLIAVYRVFRDGLASRLELVYPFIYKPETIHVLSFGFLDLSKPNIVLAVLAGAAQFWQAKTMMAKTPKIEKKEPGKEPDISAMMNKQMLYLMPALTIFIGISLPGGLTLYWFVLTLLTALQQWLMFRKKKE